MKVTKTQLKQIIAEELENMDLHEIGWINKMLGRGGKDLKGDLAPAVGADPEQPDSPASAAALEKAKILAPQLAQVDDPNEIHDLFSGLLTALTALNPSDLTQSELQRVGLGLVKMGRILQTVDLTLPATKYEPEKEAAQMAAYAATRPRRVTRHGGGGIGSQITGKGAGAQRRPSQFRENKKKRRAKRRK